jgi:hypothetical protein
MFPSEHETRYITRQYPEGGITPSRYDLALHEYVQKQNEHRQHLDSLPKVHSYNSLMDWLSSWLVRLTSKHPADHRAR